jgi:hypothetical protein
MPRYRKLHVKTVESLDVNDMPDDFTRLFWVLLPLGLCREGRGLDNSAWIKAKLFPLRLDVIPEMITNAMAWFCERGMVVRYEVEGRHYFHVPSFARYQGTTTKEAESDYPPPPCQVQSKSRASPEPVQTKSSTDSIFNIQYSDADADAGAPESLPPSPAALISADAYPELKLEPQQWAVLDRLLSSKATSAKHLASALEWARGKAIIDVQAISTTAINWNDKKPSRGRDPPGGAFERAAAAFLAEEE